MVDVEMDKENDVALQDKSDNFSSTPKAQRPRGSEDASGDGAREYPETPVGRVPLAELFGNNEDNFEHQPSLTPVERILWNPSPDSSDQPRLFRTPASKNGGKRARSSSPTSSQNATTNRPTSPQTMPSFDLQTLHKSLATPQADPAGDLWSRYSINSINRQTPSKLAASVPVNLFQSSSPEFLPRQRSSSESAKLRRTMSCGVTWPTSAAKRRKIQKSHSQVVNYSPKVTSNVLEEQHGETKISRVSFLLEKVHNGLTSQLQEPKHKHRTLHSSSPTLNSGLSDMNFPASPLQGHSVKPSEMPISKESNSSQEEPAKESAAVEKLDSPDIEPELPDRDSVSEYGDDCIDLEFIEAVDTSILAEECLAKSNISTDYRKSAGEGAREDRSQQLERRFPESRRAIGDKEQVLGNSSIKESSQNLQAPQAEIHLSEDDEFGDDDFDDEEVGDLLTVEIEVAPAIEDRKPLDDNSKRSTMSEIGGKEPNIQLKESGSCFATAISEPCQRKVVEVSSDNEFGDELDFEEIAAEYAQATQAAKAPIVSSNDKRVSIIQRYLIKSIDEGQYTTAKGYNRQEKILIVQDEKTKISKVVVLQESWFESPCTLGSYIHVLGIFDAGGQCTINDAQNMLILHPDHLISATVVADSFGCIRRAVLQDRVKATNDANEPQVYGHILHEVFQEAMKANRWDRDWLEVTIRNTAARYLETLFEINVEMTRAVDHLMSKVPELQSWAEIFVRARPRADGIVKDRNGAHALMSVNKLLDVEEHVWSPTYGLKGNVDATVQVLMKDGENERTLTVPFEVKTGRNISNAAHKAQTALYTLLLSDRYDVEVAYGILYYMETSEISRIPAMRNELMHMILQRNELACYVRQRLELPPMLKSPHLCGKCYAKVPCFVYHKLVDDGDGETSGMKVKFDDMVQHLKPIHQNFFRKWDNLLTKEETDVLKFRRELWTMLSSEREKVGRCFGNIVIEPDSAIELTDAPKINRFRYSFIKHKPASAFSFADSQITTGEPIVISDEKGHYALANGYVTQVRRHRMTVAVDRRLHNARVKREDFDEHHNQSFTGIMEIVEEGTKQSSTVPKEPEEQVLYRLDKDEFSNGMATARNNLIRVMEKDIFGAQALRKLVIEGVAPTFRTMSSGASLSETSSQASLNVDQRKAIEKVMSAKDYALVLGMPGTGKTTTIAHIIRALAAKGKSILLTSYTHTAVDNILLKIRNDNIGILRLGAVAKVHQEVQEFADLAGVPKTTTEELEQSYQKQIVATTCLGINHPIFNQRIFDYCIVDEASQITLPVCLGPIRMARTFILVGDHYQLPPLVQNKEAQEGGLDISLFKLLSDKHPESVVNLEHQYRMCSDIMSLSNTLIYNGRLKCGTQAVADREITIPNMSALKLHHHPPSTISASHLSLCLSPTLDSCWLRSLLSPAVKVAFINTDLLLPLSREIAKGSRITNPIEAALTAQLVEALITVGVAPPDIGVITLYRSQLALLKHNLRHRSSAGSCPPRDRASAVEMHTADKFQGRDKEVVVLSLVRSNDAGHVGDLLKDWRRVNVALTRAQTKLLVVGSWETIRRGNELLGRFCGLVEERGWRVDLARDALGGHLFEEGGTQVGEEREALREMVENVGGGGMGMGRVPEKRGKMDIRALLEKRPVLRDVVSEAMA